MAAYGYLTSSPYHETVHNHNHQCSKASYYLHKRGDNCCGITVDNLLFLVKLINFILFFVCLVTLTFIALYDKPSFGDDRDYLHLPVIRSFLPDSHPLNLLHCQLIICSLLICTIAVANLALECHYSSTKFKMKDDFHDHHEMDELAGGFCSHQGTPYGNSITTSEKVAYSLPSFPICLSIFAYLMLFTVQLCLGTFAILSVYGSSSDEGYKDGFERSMIMQIGQPDEILYSRSQILDVLQSELKCCGINGYQDYSLEKLTSNRRNNVSIPESCCKTPMPKCGERVHPNNIHYVGCAKKMAKIASNNILLLGWITILFLILEFVAIVFSCCLYIQSVASR
ncbi:uncharacterized protein LOC141850601 [Brevipalpus obovatus]|uniref:uncharacterized protein LOC141850601 n=1 Tax=Brevipalpus obovatus TaxID=246614 RepID=UPI003D9F348C